MELNWSSLDTWTAITAAIAAMSCAVPGTFLVLRRQSMLGDALSHTALPGIVGAFLCAHWFESVIGTATQNSFSFHTLLLAGAVLAGLLTAFLTETVQRLGSVDGSAALGVVYTSLFALGLLMVRMFADELPHVDADCVLYGNVEIVVLDTIGQTDIPVAAVMSGVALILNLAIVLLCFKELKIATFDPALASSLGLKTSIVHYLLMAVTALTLVAAFRSVGSILVITVLVAPAATAWLLSDRLSAMLTTTVLLAGASAVFGHLLAIVAPIAIFQPLGFPDVEDSSTSGMTSLVCGGLFVLALLFSPKRGLIINMARQARLSFQIACEDVLGMLYRQEELNDAVTLAPQFAGWTRTVSPVISRLAMWRLRRQGLLAAVGSGYGLTRNGRDTAEQLVRSHRLWESYMARHFPLADDHLHETAHRVEHYLDAPLLSALEKELDQPGEDPHGRSIPRSGPTQNDER
jgi:manganese/zinc/iron transport system permease protein